MLHNLINILSDNFSNSLKGSFSQVDFMPGTLCFFVLNHADQEVFCHINPALADQENITIKRKQSFRSFLKNIHQEDRLIFLEQQRKIRCNLEAWVSKGQDELKFFQDVRFRLKSDHFIRLLIQQRVLSYKQYRPVWSVGTCTDISHIKEGNELSLAVFSQGKHLALEKVVGRGSKKFFTEREIEVLQLLSKGYKSKEIEQVLHISFHTVRTHRRNMLKKTSLESTTQLVNFAIKQGILKSDI